MLYTFGRTVTYWLVRLLFRVRYVGLENIPKTKGFLLACNHRSNFDPLFIAHKLGHPVHYMAKIELFRVPVLGFLLPHLKAFPVSRGTGDTGAMDSAREIIRTGEVLGIFPEGHRSKDGKPQRARSGVAMIAGQTGAGVLPCAVCFGEKLRLRSLVTIRYGKLIPPEQLKVQLESPSTVRAAAKLVMDEIERLLAAPEGGLQ